MARFVKFAFTALAMSIFTGASSGQDTYELRKLTQEDWLSMTTDQRMNALSITNKMAENQTLLGDFRRHPNLYKRWGYEFYEMEDKYENYSFRGFENYNIIEERRRRWSYNQFGDRIPRMRVSYTLWNETYNDDGTSAVSMTPGTSYINSVLGGVDGVWVLKEATNDWAISAVSAGALRCKYTPLTMNLPNVNGIKIDLHSSNNEISFMSSVPLGEVLLRGGHIRHKFGALTLGGSYVTQYQTVGNRQDSHSSYGTVHNYSPTPMVLCIRVLDDSPEDGEGGPLVNNVRIRINGRYRNDIKPQVILDDLTRDRTSALIKPTELTYLTPASGVMNGFPKYDYLSLECNLPKYADYFYFNDAMRGQNLTGLSKSYNIDLAKKYYQTVQPGAPVQVNGTQYVVYLFDISSIKETVRQAEAELTVNNDYRVESGMIYTQSVSGGHDTSGNTKNWYNATYWRPAAEAEGNVKDGSNIKRITVDFGLQVASILYGFDADFNYRGFKVNGEYVTNSNHYMFPDNVPGTGFPSENISGQAPRKGYKWAEKDNAYYLTTQKDWKRFGFAGELFKMGKLYRPWLDLYYPQAAITDINIRNNIARLPFVEDNDDNDQYPDTMVNQRVMGYRILSNDDPDGVFPGNDEDHDGIADNNKNLNGIPDYNEAFMMFDVDPDEFVFGNDYNNNGIPDFREDDMKMDTPYDFDRQGHHIYVRYSPIESVNLYLGSFRTKGIGRDNRTNDDYFKLQVNYDVFAVGKLYAEYRHEKISDNIQDQYIQVANILNEDFTIPGITASLRRFEREIYYDELEYRNSSVDRLFVESRIRAIPSITIENHMRLERNHQIEGVMYDNVYQPGLDINTVAMVNKIVYTKSWGNWTFSPGLKFRFYKKDRSESVRAKDFYMVRIPLVMLRYIISPRTDMMIGMQGVPGLEFKFKDYVESANDYNQRTYTLQLQNRTTYFGYQIWAATGIRYDNMRYYESFRSFENYKTSTMFVKILLGY